MANFIEELVGEYYKTKGYLVTTNYWIPFQTSRNRTLYGKKQNYQAQSWTDIDVLARNDKEILIIQVKSGITSRNVAEKINLYFERVIKFLNDGIAPDGIGKIEWWTRNCKIIKIVVYEEQYTPPSYLKIMQDVGIETKFFGDYLKEIIAYVQNKKGVKEENSVMRLLHFLHNQNMLDIIEPTSPKH
ncbi:MAG: hypothetical protein H6605_02435 [Flavobacteriales bacterium]|nr:hypothetical protein [Flavobacteriales bacterium]